MVVGAREEGPHVEGLAASCFGSGDVLDMKDGGLVVVNFGTLGEETNGDANPFVLLGERMILFGVVEEESTLEVSGF